MTVFSSPLDPPLAPCLTSVGDQVLEGGRAVGRSRVARHRRPAGSAADP